MFEFDPRNVLSQFSPTQFQQLLTSLATQTLSDPPSNFGYPYIAPEALIPFGPYESASSQEQQVHEERMGKEWENAEIMEDNVNGLNSRIHSLAEALGLDPVLLDSDLGGQTVGAENDDEKNDGMNIGLQGQQSSSTGTTEGLPSSFSPPLPPLHPPSPPPTTTTGAAPAGDFDFDFFFNNIGSSTTSGIGTDLDSGMDYTSTTFLDEVPTPASSSDTSHDGPAKGTRKRKSEVAMDLDIQETNPLTTPGTRTTTGGNKSKRRKDK
jgi:hypothetical protein